MVQVRILAAEQWFARAGEDRYSVHRFPALFLWDGSGLPPVLPNFRSAVSAGDFWRKK
jgi:hypothetical protein